MIHVPRVFVFECLVRNPWPCSIRVVSQLHRQDIWGFRFCWQADKYWYVVFFCLFSSIYILLRVYYAIMSDREFIRANGESRCVDTEIANERTDARPRISRYTIRMLLPARIYLPTFASPHYFVQSGNSKPEISRLRFYFTPLWNRICPVRFGLYTRLDK